jgi:hypothetical protein
MTTIPVDLSFFERLQGNDEVVCSCLGRAGLIPVTQPPLLSGRDGQRFVGMRHVFLVVKAVPWTTGCLQFLMYFYLQSVSKDTTYVVSEVHA